MDLAKIAGLTVLGMSAPTGKSFAEALQPASKATVLFEDVRIFDGSSDTLSAPSDVLIRGSKIERISTAPISVDRRADTPSQINAKALRSDSANW